MRKTVLAVLVLFSVAAMATEQNVIAIYQTNGEVSLFAFAERPEVSYSATDLILSSTKGTVQYPISNLRKVAFERADMPEGMDEIEASRQFIFRDGQIIIEGGTPDALVNIYSVQGALVSQCRLDGNGNAAISTNGYSGAVYILTAGSVTFKFMQP